MREQAAPPGTTQDFLSLIWNFPGAERFGKVAAVTLAPVRKKRRVGETVSLLQVRFVACPHGAFGG